MLDGQRITSTNHFISTIAQRQPGSEIKLEIWRDGKAMKTSFKLGAVTIRQWKPLFLDAANAKDTHWLVRDHAVTVLPSVSSLKALRAHAKTSKADRQLVGFANPLLDGDKYDQWHRHAALAARKITGCAAAKKFKTAQLRSVRRAIVPLRGINANVVREQVPLPETADELCEIARSADTGPNSTSVYLGDKASESTLKKLSQTGVLSRYRIVHFATHGALAGELSATSEPGLILTPPGKTDPDNDGYLSASEIVELKLDADWVLLSACNTAGGSTTSAEALSGLARAFFYSGARALLVSHWYVDSEATVALITKAFDQLCDNPDIGRSEALRRSMLALINNDKRGWHPSIWAPFVVVGEGATDRQ